jgi:hypothetical protein
MTNEFRRFVQERDEALKSLDEAKIKAYMLKWLGRYPSSPRVFWASVHKARLGLNTMTAQEKAASRDWLSSHGFRPVAPYE